MSSSGKPLITLTTLASLLGSFSLFSAGAAGLAPDPGFDAPRFTQPNPATRTLLQPDGKFFRFGATETVAGERTGAMTRHFPDGSIDPTFQVRDFELVLAAAVHVDGKIVVSGLQRRYDVRIERVLRLNSDGSVDPTFQMTELEPHNTFGVQGIVPLPDGKILLSGTMPIGNRSLGLIRLMPDGSRDTSFAAATELIGPTKPAVQPDGKIVIVGTFRRIDTSNFPLGIARLNPDGTLDTTFQPSGFARILTIRDPIVQNDGKIVLGGRFSVDANFASNPTGAMYFNLPLVRLNPNGSIDESYGYFNPQAQPFTIRSLAMSGEKIIASDAGTQSTVFRFNADGSLDTSFRQPVFRSNGRTNTPAVLYGMAIPFNVAVQPDERVLVSGTFTDVETEGVNGSRYGLVRLNNDGSVDPTLTTPYKTGFKVSPYDFVRLPNGQTLIGFKAISVTADTAVPHNFARLAADGSLDLSFDPASDADPAGALGPNFIAQGFRLFSDGKIFLFGTDLSSGAFRYGRLLPDGTEDTAFEPDPRIMETLFEPDDIIPQRTGAVVIASSSPQVILNHGPTRRIAPDGSLDTSFKLDEAISSALVEREPGTQLPRRVLAGTRVPTVGPDGKLLFVFGLSELGDARLVRLNPDGTLDGSFQAVPIVSPAIYLYFPQIYDSYTGQTLQPSEGVVQGEAIADAAVQADGRIIIVGPFTAINQAALPQIARLNPDGTLDNTFNVGAGPQWISTTSNGSLRPVIEQVKLQSDGRLLLAGTFEAFNGVPAPGIVRLNPDGSVDTTFVAPAVRQKTVAGRAKLARQPDGSFLLSGPYSYSGETSAPSLLRLVPPAVANISTRISIGTGENVLIGGFIVTGNAPTKVIIRGLGPSLRAGDQFVPGRLEDPTMELRTRAGAVILSNDDWRTNQQQEIIDTQVPPTDDREPAIVATLDPGAYTAIVKGKNNATGIGLVEVYDLGTASFDSAAVSTLANISTRGFVQTGDNVMIGGFIVTGAPARAIVRAVGPSLTAAGVAGALQDTTLSFVDGNGVTVATNDDWRTGGQEQEIIATTVPPSDNRESAVVLTLAPGAYTALVRGKDSATGVALVEVYALQ